MRREARPQGLQEIRIKIPALPGTKFPVAAAGDLATRSRPSHGFAANVTWGGVPLQVSPCVLVCHLERIKNLPPKVTG